MGIQKEQNFFPANALWIIITVPRGFLVLFNKVHLTSCVLFYYYNNIEINHYIPLTDFNIGKINNMLNEKNVVCIYGVTKLHIFYQMFHCL